MRLLLSYLRPHRGIVILAVFLAVVNQVFSLLDPQIFRLIVDRYATRIGSIPWAEFIRGAGLLTLASVGVAMVSRVAKNFQDYFLNVAAQSAGAALYADGIAHSLRLPFRAFEDQQSGAVLQQLQKARSDSRDMIGQSVNTLFISALSFLLVTGYSFWVHWSIGLSLVVLSPLLAIVVSSLARRIKVVQARIFSETNALAGSTTESLRNIELIKSLGLETQEIDRLNATNTADPGAGAGQGEDGEDLDVLPGHGHQLHALGAHPPDADPGLLQADHPGRAFQSPLLLLCHFLPAGRDRATSSPSTRRHASAWRTSGASWRRSRRLPTRPAPSRMAWSPSSSPP